MRIGALLSVGFALMLAAACNADTSSDLVCASSDGTCIALSDGGGIPLTCGEQVSGATCDPGYVCCTVAAGQPAVNEAGVLIESADSGVTAASSSSTTASSSSSAAH